MNVCRQDVDLAIAVQVGGGEGAEDASNGNRFCNWEGPFAVAEENRDVLGIDVGHQEVNLPSPFSQQQ